MNRWLAVFVLAGMWTAAAPAAGKGPEIQVINDKLSVDAESVPLSRLLRLLDLATGMKSKVPPDLANRNISAKFSGLDLREGVQKIFQGQPLDYVVIEGAGIIVTAASQSTPASDSASAPAPVYISPPAETFQDFSPPQPVQPPAQQPAMIQTPFGPIANPRAAQAVPAPNAPLNAPGQQNTLFPGQPQPQPVQQAPVMPPFPGSQPATSPFASPSPFGTTQPPVQNQPNLFGGPQPVFTNPAGTQQRTP